jgi:beta-N-acetylhexosaminidase
MFMVGYASADPMAASDLIRRYHVGGIILFSRNIRDAAHAAEVCQKLQELRRQVSDSPLFIAVDQEGGCVARITQGVTVFPGNMALGATGSEHLARRAANVTAAELLALGINVNLAPVLDISSNPRNPGLGARSFGSDAALAARLGSAMIVGMQEKGILAAAKHFPGLGDAHVDSHNELPIVDVAGERLESRELLPFRAGIDAGVAFVMSAHCSYPSLDGTLAPATLSEPILTGLLRERMGFKGIVITDCLEMAAIEKNFPAAQSALMAVRAGANMVLICHTLKKQTSAIDSLAAAVKTGDISEEIIDAAIAKISSTKKRLGFCDSSTPLKVEPQTSLSESMAAEAITIVRNEGSIVPLRLAPSDRLGVVVPRFEMLTKVEDAAEPHEAFIEEVRRRHPRVLYHNVAVEPTPGEIDECMGMCREADTLVVLTYNLHLYAAQKDFVRSILDLGKPTLVAAVRDPYDLAFVPGARACVATYSFRDCSLRALAKVLFGDSKAKGRLPVELA